MRYAQRIYRNVYTETFTGCPRNVDDNSEDYSSYWIPYYEFLVIYRACWVMRGGKK